MHKSPLIISGIGRSGTSAVISSMSKHKLVVEPHRIGEAPFISHFINFLIDYENKSPHKEYHFKNYQLDKRERDKAFSKLLSQLQYGFDVDSVSSKKKFWVAKVSFDKRAFEKCQSIFDGLRLIYVMRNGIEVVNSAMSFKGFQNLSFEQLCQRWKNNLEGCRYVHSNPSCAVIRHDRLVQDPVTVFKEIFIKLAIEHDDSPAQFISSTLFNSSFDKSTKITSTNDIFKDRLDCWEQWSQVQKNTFIDICGPCMKEFGFLAPYDCSTTDIYRAEKNKRSKITDKGEPSSEVEA